ncbi:MAG: glycosyltransferase family 4 protein [Lamprobacter sp.]|uniref:glycosyltransferase family 4 protein n=1 Tax=Lamprobacter sp. TaxID=3100796 RepID=UPI002B262203|nr:glycosyltransferase family 4 protein [Lamprobacter sp.]MEA3641093.1 glycosyltransferase family 4 protein [Lamprobacter sp.]
MIIISNGFSKFHLAPAAAEMDRSRLLSCFFTGAYPTAFVVRFLRTTGLERSKKFQRLIARRETILESRVIAFWGAEALYIIGQWLMKNRWKKFERLGSWINNQSMINYGRSAKRIIEDARCMDNPIIYHYRAGFGHASLKRAKLKGMIRLCDHSIAHPALVDWIIEHRGLLPAKDEDVKEESGFWRMILEDIQKADAVLVNSEFVKQTFLNRGWDPRLVHVIYLGVDDAFFSAIPERKAQDRSDEAPIRFTFAGSFEQRKGADALVTAISLLRQRNVSMQLDIFGTAPVQITAQYPRIVEDDRVHLHGLLSRTELAHRLSETDVFVFPSLAEGSARVVFEALACGCYVITTPNSGSIVEDGVHGRLIPPGDAVRLADAMQEAIRLDRPHLRAVGLENANLIRSRYRQVHYGDKLEQLYSRLVNTTARVA